MDAMYEKTLKLIVTLDKRQPAKSMPARLDGLFQRLAADPTARDAYAVEDLIWELWTDHPEPLAAGMMDRAIAAVAQKNCDMAERIFGELAETHPQWAEVWNKRATLYFLQGRDDESVRDIHRTLELEPRHFGALSGFAEICLRNGDRGAALLAFEAALRINPHLTTVQDAVVELHYAFPPTVH